MKIVCNREGLSTAFGIVSTVVPSRSPKPILQNLKLDVNADGSATLMATDLELGIRYRVSGVTAEQPGPVMLPTALMAPILRELHDETIELESTDSGLRVVGTSAKFLLPAEDPQQFPEVPPFGDAPGHRVSARVLATLIRRTVFAAASENSRYALNSILMDTKDGHMVMVTTDGKRLAMMTGEAALTAAVPAGTTLIHPKAAALLLKTLVDPDEEVEIAINDRDAQFRTHKVTIYSRLVEGRFPRYQDIIPKGNPIRVPLLVSPFLAALRQAKIVTDSESKAVDFGFETGSLTLRTQTANIGESEIRMPVGFDGDPITVTYDPQLLIDALRVLDAEQEITLEILDNKKASVIRSNDNYTYVIMPLSKERPAVKDS